MLLVDYLHCLLKVSRKACEANKWFCCFFCRQSWIYFAHVCNDMLVEVQDARCYAILVRTITWQNMFLPNSTRLPGLSTKQCCPQNECQHLVLMPVQQVSALSSTKYTKKWSQRTLFTGDRINTWKYLNIRNVFSALPREVYAVATVFYKMWFFSYYFTSSRMLL